MGKYYRHPKFGRVYGTTLKTPIGRLCWPALATPKEDNFQGVVTSRYGITILLKKDDPKTQAFVDSINTMLDEEGGMLEIFNEHADVRISLNSEVLKDGDGFDMEKYPYYAGQYVVLARNEKQIPVYGPTGKDEVLDPSMIKGGVLGRVILTPHLGPSGVSFKAEAVQYYKDDGVKLGGSARNINDMLDSIAEDDDTESAAAEQVEEQVEEQAVVPAPVQTRPVTPVVQTPRGRGRPPTASNMRAQVAAQAPQANPTAAALRANMAQGTTQVNRVAAGAKVVTTGKGKALALNNL
jgi:hypothetical protein